MSRRRVKSAALGLGLALTVLLMTAPARAATYKGAALLFHLEQVTIVYPAGAGEDVVTNRLSAKRRAAFLREVHGVESRVIGDDEVDAATLGQDLLLLGWGNRLLATEEHPEPIVKKDDGRSVLGVFQLKPGEDLFLQYPSPHDADRWLFFWSRINLEQDRFSVLPFEGSMWAVFDGYRVERQGMFSPGAEWPPRRDPAAEMTYQRKATSGTRQSPHYTAHFDPTLVSGERIEEILAAREIAWKSAVEALGAPADTFRVDLHVYLDEEQKKLASGVSDAVHSDPLRRELHMVERLAGVASPHEEIHLLARERLGPCHLSAFYEGLAVDIEQSGGEVARAVSAGLLLEGKRMPPLETLLDEEGFRASSRDGSGFSAAALLVHWLRHVQAPKQFAGLYVERTLSMSDLARALGRSDDELQTAFDRWLNDLSSGAKVETAFRRARAEADQLRRSGDAEGAARALERALEVKPGDMSTLLRLSSALTDMGAFEDAERRLNELLEFTGSPENAHFAGFVHYRLGKLYDIQGKPDEAGKAFRRALALPDHNDVHKRVRETMAALGFTEDGD